MWSLRLRKQHQAPRRTISPLRPTNDHEPTYPPTSNPNPAHQLYSSTSIYFLATTHYLQYHPTLPPLLPRSTPNPTNPYRARPSPNPSPNNPPPPTRNKPIHLDPLPTLPNHPRRPSTTTTSPPNMATLRRPQPTPTQRYRNGRLNGRRQGPRCRAVYGIRL